MSYDVNYISFMMNKIFTSLVYENKNIPEIKNFKLKPNTLVMNATLSKKADHFCANWNFGIFSDDICILNDKSDNLDETLVSWMELHLKSVINGDAPILFDNEVVFEDMMIDITKPANLEYIVIDKQKLIYYMKKYPQYKFKGI